MEKKVFVFDPTVKDSLSRVRGIGRYLSLLKENFSHEFVFTNNLSTIPNDPGSVFINPFLNFLQPPITMKKLAKKQVAIIHDLIPLKYGSHFPAGIKGNLNIFLNKLSLKNYDLIITDSEASKKDIVNILRLPESIIRVVYPCLSRSFTEDHKLQSDEKDSKYEILNSKYCLYVGDATWNKNIVNLARAIKIINVTCIFVGKVFEQVSNNYDPRNLSNPWLAELKNFINEVGGDKRFIFAGFVPDKDLIKFYKHSLLNILPSRDEGFGFSFLESAYNSCPSVLSDIPVLREVADGKALFVDPNNPNDIADKIGELYFRRDQRNKLGRQAFQRGQFFNSKKFKEDFLSNIE